MRIVSIYTGYDVFSVDDWIEPYFAFELNHNVTNRVFVTWLREKADEMMADYIEVDRDCRIYKMTEEEFALFILTHA